MRKSPARDARKRLLLAGGRQWRGDRQRHVRSALLSLLFHLALLLLLATFTFGPGKGLIGFGQLGLGEATVRLDDERPSELDARELLKEIKIDPLPVPDRKKAAPKVPSLRSLGPAPVSHESLEHISARFSLPAEVGGLGGDFGSMIGRLRREGLDVVVVIDASGSMQFVIDEMKERMAGLVANLQRLVPTTRVGAVAFRDRGDEFAVRWSDLSFHGDKIQSFLSHLRAEGGGDWEEAVLDALETAIRDLGWRRRSKKVIILLGGSPPRREEMPAILELVGDFHRRGGVVNTIDITKRLHQQFERSLERSRGGSEPAGGSPMPAFYREVTETYGEIARAGGGELAGLGWDEELTGEILVSTFGSRWRADLMGVVNDGRADDRS